MVAPVKEKKKKKSRGGNACTLNVFIVECSSVPYIMVLKKKKSKYHLECQHSVGFEEM